MQAPRSVPLVSRPQVDPDISTVDVPDDGISHFGEERSSSITGLYLVHIPLSHRH